MRIESGATNDMLGFARHPLTRYFPADAPPFHPHALPPAKTSHKQLRMPPADSPYSFLVNLGLGPDGAPTPTAGLAQGRAASASTIATAAVGAGARGAAGGSADEEEGAGGVVPLLKDASGRVRVQVAAPRRREEAPSVMTKRWQGESSGLVMAGSHRGES